MKIENIFNNLPIDPSQEHFTDIIHSNNVRIERIVSYAESSASKEWYDQEENEWIMVLQGSAAIVFEDAQIVTLKTGDNILIPTHKKHRVIKTSPDEATIWLAIFYR